jgi:uncharacterized membrane protein YfcA
MNRLDNDWKLIQLLLPGSYLMFYAGLWIGTTIAIVLLSLILSVILLTVVMIFFFTHRKQHSRQMTWMVALVVPLLSGFAASSIWLDPEATYVWTFHGETFATFAIIIILWTVFLRFLPWKRVVAWLSLMDLIVAVILGIVWLETRFFALEMLLVALFFLPIAIGIVVLASTPRLIDSVVPLSLFGAFLLVYIVALIVVTEGEGVGALEALGDVSASGTRARKPKSSSKSPLN